MKKSLVLLSFVKQRARQLKKEKSLSQSQALDEAAKESGYSNYRNYLNLLDATHKQSKSLKDFLLQELSSESDMSKKIDLAVAFIQNPETPFQDLLDILKLFQYSKEALQFLCEKSNVKNEIHQDWLDYFLNGEGAAEMDEYYVAKDISLSNLCYAIDEDLLCIDGSYDLTMKFEFEVEERYRGYPHFEDRILSGFFELTIDRNKKITVLNG